METWALRMCLLKSCQKLGVRVVGDFGLPHGEGVGVLLISGRDFLKLTTEFHVRPWHG